ncbi:nuclear transport factor 2 family protein [Maribacter sp.]|nr:nuclear transport factor 2 family protein [Maribacter sp.]
MKRTFKNIFVLFLITFISLASHAQVPSAEITAQIQAQIEKLKTAHLNSDVTLADKLYHPNLILTSQSGKKYNKDVALINIKNTFESYKNSEIQWLQVSGDVVLTNYINERKYKDFDKGTYRLTVVWTRQEGEWRIISMQSSQVKERKN